MTNDELIKHIIDIEQNMFQNVKASEPSPCQDELKVFRLMRWMSYSVLPEEVLESYFDDLEKAVQEDRNFMTEKYARMENIIPPLNDNELIHEIVSIENEWMKEMHAKYPRTFEDKGAGFQNYFSCELETYSDRTLALVHKVTISARDSFRNLVEERYTNLFKKLGYNSIYERELKSMHR